MTHKLLLADDSVTIQRVIELTFADEDVQVIAVGDGKKAIASIQADRPDIVLADVGMPERDGYEVAAFIKGTAELAHIPVLLLTGAFEPIDETRARAVGCDGVLVKPFEPQMVISRVKDLLAGRKPAGVWAASPAAQTPLRQPAPAAADHALRRPWPGDRSRTTSIGSTPRLPASTGLPAPRPGGGRAAPRPPIEFTPPPAPAAARFRHPIRLPRRIRFPRRPSRHWTICRAGIPISPAIRRHPRGSSPCRSRPSRRARPRRPSCPRSRPRRRLLLLPPPAPPPRCSCGSRSTSGSGRGSGSGPRSGSRSGCRVRGAASGRRSRGAHAVACRSLRDAAVRRTGPAESRHRHWPLPIVTDQMVDEIVRRVIARMGDQAVRETVLDVAERLVREEISRIKGG